MSTQKAAEAAIERIQKQQTKYNKPNTLETILREERQKISEESKMKERVEVWLFSVDIDLTKLLNRL